jgi:hypothetical protein
MKQFAFFVYLYPSRLRVVVCDFLKGLVGNNELRAVFVFFKITSEVLLVKALHNQDDLFALGVVEASGQCSLPKLNALFTGNVG